MSVRSTTADPTCTAVADRLEAVLRIGNKHETQDTGVARGPRRETEEEAFEKARVNRLSASLLPFWVGLQDSRDSYARSRMVRIINFNKGRWKRPPKSDAEQEATTQRILKYGIDHEADAIAAYMELTRIAVALGSVRTRDALGRGDDPIFLQNQTSFEWEKLLAATPDGLTYDVLAKERNSRIKTGRGLLEVTCPAGITRAEIAPFLIRRHDVDIHFRFENRFYHLLQAWEQLEVVREAEFVDLVAWKQAPNPPPPAPPPPPPQYLWIARLFRNERMQAIIKDTLVNSFSQFQRALNAMEDGDVTMDEEEERAFRADNATDMARNELRVYETDAGGRKTEYESKIGRTEKQQIREALKNWADESLKWRNCDMARDRQNGFPWRSKKELREKSWPVDYLANRYELNTGFVATHEGDASPAGAIRGYTPLVPRVSWLFGKEHFDEGVESSRGDGSAAAASSGPLSPSGEPMHIFDAGNGETFNYNGQKCMRCGMVCRMYGITQNWADEGNTNPSAACYGSRYGTAWRELHRQQGGAPRGLMGRPAPPVEFEDMD